MSTLLNTVSSASDPSAALASYLESGTVEGQKTDLNPKSESMLEAAYAMDDCPTEAGLVQKRVAELDIQDKKKSITKKKILNNRIGKLDKNRDPRAYEDFERKFNRLKQQAMLQNPQFREGESSRQLTYEGESFFAYILRNLSMDFPEVTEQDNVLEYLLEIEEVETAANEEAILQCEKMIRRLEGQPDAKSQRRIEEFSRTAHSLREQVQFSAVARQSLGEALQNLNQIHGQEIKDGRHLIPLAVGIKSLTVGGKPMSPIDIATTYRDNLLGCENFSEVFSAIISICFGRSARG
ncbi:MAG: hypothetical protein LBJ75_01425 [Puniceicoccales bacterium]|jgi:hypothetical protein|nr:hypothetical protein [Puniceicoccales bacterium]